MDEDREVKFQSAGRKQVWFYRKVRVICLTRKTENSWDETAQASAMTSIKQPSFEIERTRTW